MLSEHLRMILERKRDGLNLPRDVARYVTDRSSADLGIYVEKPGDTLPLDNARGWRGAHVGHVVQPHLISRFCIEQQVRDIAEIVPVLGAAPNYDVEHLLLLEEA